MACFLLALTLLLLMAATGSTDDHITRSNHQEHFCCGGRGPTCWNQCMLGLNQCRYSPANTNTEPPIDDLPTHCCYSPEGNCSWYRECLEARYPCEGTEDGYAIEYGEKFCNLFSSASNYNDFSTDGRAWIDGVRRCLQLALVPSLMPWSSRTCGDIRRAAFTSHAECYLAPASGAPSACELSWSDLWRGFWIVSVEGGAFSWAPMETVKQLLSVLVGCQSASEPPFGLCSCCSTIGAILFMVVLCSYTIKCYTSVLFPNLDMLLGEP